MQCEKPRCRNSTHVPAANATFNANSAQAGGFSLALVAA